MWLLDKAEKLGLQGVSVAIAQRVLREAYRLEECQGSGTSLFSCLQWGRMFGEMRQKPHGKS